MSTPHCLENGKELCNVDILGVFCVDQKRYFQGWGAEKVWHVIVDQWHIMIILIDKVTAQQRHCATTIDTHEPPKILKTFFLSNVLYVHFLHMLDEEVIHYEQLYTLTLWSLEQWEWKRQYTTTTPTTTLHHWKNNTIALLHHEEWTYGILRLLSVTYRPSYRLYKPSLKVHSFID